jgi:hypothetical protein
LKLKNKLFVEMVKLFYIGMKFDRGTGPSDDTEASANELSSLKEDIEELKEYEETLDRHMKVQSTFNMTFSS